MCPCSESESEYRAPAKFRDPKVGGGDTGDGDGDDVAIATSEYETFN